MRSIFISFKFDLIEKWSFLPFSIFKMSVRRKTFSEEHWIKWFFPIDAVTVCAEIAFQPHPAISTWREVHNFIWKKPIAFRHFLTVPSKHTPKLLWFLSIGLLFPLWFLFKNDRKHIRIIVCYWIVRPKSRGRERERERKKRVWKKSMCIESYIKHRTEHKEDEMKTTYKIYLVFNISSMWMHVWVCCLYFNGIDAKDDVSIIIAYIFFSSVHSI